ncbi:MAG: hypothetical protein Q9196_002096 [Gyalolechia fulgens]
METKNNGYLINGCGSFTDQVALGLDLGKEPLEAAINAAKRGVLSPHGFRAFFKNNAAIGPVTNMLKNIQTMKPIRNLKPNRFKASQPEFICVKPDTFERYPALRTDPDKFCTSTGAYSFWFPGYQWVFLCKKFFTLNIAPVGPPPKLCPRVAGNAFAGGGASLANYQSYALIHEMVHFYLGHSSLGLNTKPKEMYELNRCVNMTAKDSLRSPMNWHYFIASK